MRQFFGITKDMIAGLIQIEPVAILELGGPSWIRVYAFSHWLIDRETITS